MNTPSSTELLLILGIVIILVIMVSPTYYLAKKKNLRIGWNIFWNIIFGPLWWFVMIFRKNNHKIDEKTQEYNKS